jgi:enoyl-CoA hydratase/carnithine racemase
MSDIDIRITGRAGRITFIRPQALNAMTYEMCMGLDAALRGWHDDDAVDLVVIDALGDKAFCAGGDIGELYETGMRGDYDFGRRFWRDEYRLNAYLAEFPKPVVSFMQGFVMGGGVGIGCHASHRVVEHGTRIAMPECGIGLVPDVGGSYLLARAPGRLGEYLGLTGARMGPGDAVWAGFADTYVLREHWRDLIDLLEASGDIAHIAHHAEEPPKAAMRLHRDDIDIWFASGALGDIIGALSTQTSDFAQTAKKAIRKNSPLSMACTAEIIQRLRAGTPGIRAALELEYRFTYRSMQQGDFLEGIRAQIIDKDRKPTWKYRDANVPTQAITDMLAPLGDAALNFEPKE